MRRPDRPARHHRHARKSTERAGGRLRVGRPAHHQSDLVERSHRKRRARLRQRLSRHLAHGQRRSHGHFGFDRDSCLKTADDLTLSYHPAHGLLETAGLADIEASFTYTGFGEVDTYTVDDTAAGTSLFEVDYVYDELGRIDTLIKTTDGTTRNYKFTYDERGRLIEVKLRDGQTGAYDTIESYGWDANGNRTSVDNTFDTLTASDIAVDAQDRLTSYGDLDCAYDKAGRLETKTETSTGDTTNYDEFGNLRAVELPDGRRIEYLVDGQHRRVGRILFDAQGNVTDERHWLYKDALNPIAELDAQGNLTKRFVYGSRPHVPAKQCQTPCKPVRFGARDYDPRVGRWTAKDPIGFGGGEPNLFAYVGGSPVNLTDPSGLIAPLAAIGIAVGVSVAIDAGAQYYSTGTVDLGQTAIAGLAGGVGGGLGVAARAAFAGRALIAADTLASVGVGAGANTAINAYNDRPLDEGLGAACTVNGVLGAGGSFVSTRVTSKIADNAVDSWWNYANASYPNMSISPSAWRNGMNAAAEYGGPAIRSSVKSTGNQARERESR